MREVVSALEHTPSGYGEHGPPTLELVEPLDDFVPRNPQLDPQQTAYELARGPYVGRIAALQTRLEHARAYDPEMHESGLPLAKWVIPGIHAELARRRKELAEFEKNYDKQAEPEEPSVITPVREPIAVTQLQTSPETAPIIKFGAPPRSARSRQTTPVYYDPISGLPAPAPGTILARADDSPKVRLPAETKARADNQLDREPTLFTGNKKEDDPRDGGLCAQTDPEVFFPEKGGSTKEAKRVCLVCDIREACLNYALDSDERFGIWGGYSERERRKLKKERA